MNDLNQSGDSKLDVAGDGVENITVEKINEPRGRGRPRLYTAEESMERKKESDRLRRERKAAEAGRVTEPDSSTEKIFGGGSDTVTGRKANKTKATVLNSKPNGKVTEQGQPVAVADYGAWGENAAQLLEMAGIQIFGSVGKFQSVEEKQSISAASANYFKSMGLTDLPPGWVLLGVVSMYTVSRAMTEEGGQRLSKMMPKKKSLAAGVLPVNDK